MSQRAAEYARRRELRDQRRARGECVDCGKPSRGPWRCLKCRRKLNAARKRGQ